MRPIDSSTIGLTATVPVEVVLAAGTTPLDLNNVFITSGDPTAVVAEAEHRGFPINCCAWIKGIYATVRRLGIRRVIGVAQGDCSNTHALMEVLASEGVEVIDFNYPYPKNTWALAAWTPCFSDLLHEEIRSAGDREVILGHVFHRAVQKGLHARAVQFPEGVFHDLGTPFGLTRIAQAQWAEAGQ